MGTHPARTIVKLDGDVTRLLNKDRPLLPGVPLTPLPQVIFDKTRTLWEVVCQGRWHFEDRIELGEARATIRLLQVLATMPMTHRHKIQALEDNMAWGGAGMKGTCSLIGW